MIWLTWISESLLYISYALLVGYVTLLLVPETHKPPLVFNKTVLIAAAFAIPVFSLASVLRIVMFFYEDIGFWLTLKSVLFTFEEGKAFWWIAALSIFLGGLLTGIDLEKQPQARMTAWLLLIAMFLVTGWTSHSESLYGFSGFIEHTSHFFTVCFWTGILISVGWYSKNAANWERFLKWFTPLAVTCLVVIAISGLEMMSGIAPEYVNSWMISYGQALLLKHLAVVPLTVFAMINGVLYRYRTRHNPDWNPLPWMRSESLILILVFSITGFMGQQSPPHDVSVTINESGASLLFKIFYGKETMPVGDLVINWNVWSIAIAALAAASLSFMYLSARRNAGWLRCMAAAILFIVSGYLSFMTSVQ